MRSAMRMEVSVELKGKTEKKKQSEWRKANTEQRGRAHRGKRREEIVIYAQV